MFTYDTRQLYHCSGLRRWTQESCLSALTVWSRLLPGLFSVSIPSSEWWGPAQCQSPAGAVCLQENLLSEPHTGRTSLLYSNQSDRSRSVTTSPLLFGSPSSWRVWGPNAGLRTPSTPCTPFTRGDCSSWEPAMSCSSPSLLPQWSTQMIPPVTLVPSVWISKETQWETTCLLNLHWL